MLVIAPNSSKVTEGEGRDKVRGDANGGRNGGRGGGGSEYEQAAE